MEKQHQVVSTMLISSEEVE